MDDPRRCPECDFDLMYVRARQLQIQLVIDATAEPFQLNTTDAIVCTRCGWWRPATAFDHPVPIRGATA